MAQCFGLATLHLSGSHWGDTSGYRTKLKAHDPSAIKGIRHWDGFVKPPLAVYCGLTPRLGVA
jgi:hypothetical protein